MTFQFDPVRCDDFVHPSAKVNDLDSFHAYLRGVRRGRKLSSEAISIIDALFRSIEMYNRNSYTFHLSKDFPDSDKKQMESKINSIRSFFESHCDTYWISRRWANSPDGQLCVNISLERGAQALGYRQRHTR